MASITLDTPLTHPARNDTQPGAEVAPRVPCPAHVLVADDDPSFAGLVERYLRLAGYEVNVASDGDEALELMASTGPQVVLADIDMPKMNGIGLARAVRQQYPDVQVVLMTGCPDVKSATDAVELGACHYLIKPFERKELIGAIAQAAEEHRRAEESHSALRLLRSVQDESRKIAALRRTLGEVIDDLWIAYQPIVRAKDGGLFGYEALLRSNDPRLPSPAAVLGVAEQLDQIHALGSAVRARSAEPFSAASGDALLFVNLHSCDLMDEDLFATESPLSQIAHRVVLEVTERAHLNDIDDIAPRVARLRKMGFRVAVDDLGAGYAAICTVATLEPEIVKLDMELVRDINRNRTKSHIVRHLVAMAHESGALVVAEGVETEAERSALVELECDLLQGYLIGRPGKMPPRGGGIAIDSSHGDARA